ncbi:hypothetical protein A2V68_01640 [candidate division Kazan bacterium RBG_13_50_9]|uniref:LysM domain-containing protein n=1 Tax=candidate division Kazan bacterium RBG_13_50_9 TaxID=1798535 RepID=A0A1F4NSK4_UNCK3|nr:MAG: hypothetical protein A2V68_01640 [candidate division Kazan bacterium RBG_13_50_9]
MALLCVVAWLPTLALPVAAVSDGGVSVFPARTSEYPNLRSWFVYEAELGTTIEDRVDVINQSNKTETLIVAALDGAVTNDGGYTLVGSKEQNKDVGTWVTLEKEEVTLLPKTSKQLKVTIKVPENADVGSHPGGIVIWRKPAESAAAKSGGQLSVITRVAARLYLTVPGDIQRILEVENVSHYISGGVLYFRIKLHNRGNVQLNPVADLTLRGLFGSLGEQKSNHLGLLLRDTSITSRTAWHGKLPTFGRYVATFRIHYGEKDFKNQYVKDEYIDVRYVFWILPWLWISIVVAVLVALIFTRNLWLWLLIQQRLNIKTKKHKVKKGETLTTIATLHDKHPKKIAKFNLLRWPYDLAEGDILLIPVGRTTKAERQALWKEFKGLKASGKLEPVVADKGDTLKDVAGFAGVSIREVIAINHLRWPYKLRAGQELLVPTKGAAAAIPQTALKLEPVVVERGDTLKDVAKFAGVSIREIIAINHLRWPYRLRAGREVMVPIKQRTTTKPKQATKKSIKSSASRSPKTKNKRRK